MRSGLTLDPWRMAAVPKKPKMREANVSSDLVVSLLCW